MLLSHDMAPDRAKLKLGGKALQPGRNSPQHAMTDPSSSTPIPATVTPSSASTAADDAERNRLLAEMAEQSTDMISRHTPGDWRFIYASPAVTHLLGYEVDEIIGLSAYELYHPDDVEDFQRRSPTVSYQRGLYTHTYRFRCKDGHYIWLESTSRSMRDPETGELKEILVVSRDASHRIETEQANQRLARVLERSSDLVLFVTPDLQITHLNEAAQQTLGLQGIAFEQLQLNALLTPASFKVLTELGFPAVADNSTDNKAWSCELEMQGNDGTKVPVLLELLAHFSFQGPLEYYSLVARNLTEAKQAQAELKRYQDEINHASRLIAMGELASSLAHELNQPLTAIVNYVSGIQRRFSGQEQIAWRELEFPLEKMSSTAMRAGHIIHHMMDFTRKQEPHKEVVKLSDVVQDLIEFCAANAEKHQVSVLNHISDQTLSVFADRIQLEQILLNLMINGIEACSALDRELDRALDSALDSGKKTDPEQTNLNQEHQDHRKVEISATSQQDGKVKISVTDQGIGLPDEALDQVFEQFFTTKKTGLGMGLAISRSLVESQDGQLWAENNPTGGACFSFTLNQV